MNSKEFYITCAMGAMAVLLSIALITLTQSNRSINAALAQQQDVINRGRVGQQVGQAVLRDMAAVSLQNQKMKDLLSRQGFNVTAQSGAD